MSLKRSLSFFICILSVFSFTLSGCTIKKANNESNENSQSAKAYDWPLSDLNKYYGNTFGQGQITDINVQIADKDWEDMKTNAIKEEFHTADITVNGTTVKNVGFRTKGFSSLTAVANSTSDRYGFKVKLDKYVDGQTLNGLDTFVLNGSFSDPSYMREYLTYAASAYLGCKTPFISYSKLSINGKLFGFYLCVESYDDSFVKRNTNSDDTVLYKANTETCTLLSSDNGKGFDIDYGKDENYTNIKKLISVLNNTTADNKADLEAVLDVDSVLKSTALNTVMGNYDSYNGSKAHNYYLLYSGGKFSYVGWDYNMSIGGFSEDNGSSVTVDIKKPVSGVDISKRPLIGKLLAIDEYYNRYLGYINSLSSYLSDFESKVTSIANAIRDCVKNDPSAFYSIDKFESNIKSTGTDLTKKAANMPNNNGGMQFPGGYGDGQQTPPDGNGQNPNGNNQQTPPAGNGQNPNGNNQQTPPDGNKKPDFKYGGGFPGQSGDKVQPNFGDNSGSDTQGRKMPDFKYGEIPGNGYGDKRQGGGGMISNDACSIVDYITQRLTNIKTQLGK